METKEKHNLIIPSYHSFASLTTDERRKIVYANFAIIYPDSLLTKDYLSGKIAFRKVSEKQTKKQKQKELFHD